MNTIQNRNVYISFWMVHCGIWDGCIVEFVRKVQYPTNTPIANRALIQYKDVISYQYRKSHCGDKTILRPFYLHSGICYTGKTSLYWIRAQARLCNSLPNRSIARVSLFQQSFTQRSLNKMTEILQTTLSNIFIWSYFCVNFYSIFTEVGSWGLYWFKQCQFVGIGVGR